MFDLTGKKALITGATGGIGAAIARALHANGATVALSGTRAAVLEDVKASLAERAHTLTCNLSDAEDVEKLIPAAQDAMDGLDILVNNAGITRDNLAMRMKREDWQAVLDVNLTAAFTLTKNCMRTMMKQRWGRVINITSVVGVTGNAGQANYAASKAGIMGLTKSLAREVAGRGITVNAVAPGFIDTEMTATLSDKVKDSMLQQIPMGRIGSPRDVAEAVYWLCSDAAGYITGQVIHVNGGMYM
jgi:3-oxoacyl-[acyl-carrier protein] reductase